MLIRWFCPRRGPGTSWRRARRPRCSICSITVTDGNLRVINHRTGHLRAVQLLLGHTKIESTVRYLGIEVDDALAIAEQVDVRITRAERTGSATL